MVKEKLDAFIDISIVTKHYEKAAEFYNTCRKAGVQGSHIDFLICAVAYEMNLEIFTADKDFLFYSKQIPIRLYEPIKDVS